MAAGVLVVDDNPTNRLILSQTCSSWGMITFEADNAAKAWQLLAALESSKPFSLVLLDDVMPGADGFAALKQILAIDASLPVVLMSSHNEPGSLTKARALGAAAYVAKPVRRAELLPLISTLLRPNPKKDRSPNPSKQTPDTTRILIAEDSEDNRFLLRAYLENLPNYALTLVENGQQAAGYLRPSPVRSGADGRSHAGHGRPVRYRFDSRTGTRTLHPGHANRGLLTADALTEDVERSHAAGCNAHLD